MDPQLRDQILVWATIGIAVLTALIKVLSSM